MLHNQIRLHDIQYFVTCSLLVFIVKANSTWLMMASVKSGEKGVTQLLIFEQQLSNDRASKYNMFFQGMSCGY